MNIDTIVADAALVSQRLSICRKCPSYKGKFAGIFPWSSFARCGECGCFLKAKAGLQGMHCPSGKW